MPKEYQSIITDSAYLPKILNAEALRGWVLAAAVGATYSQTAERIQLDRVTVILERDIS